MVDSRVSWALGGVGAVSLITLALVAGCGDEDRADPIGDGGICIGVCIDASNDAVEDAGDGSDEGGGGGDAGPDGYVGPVGTAYGTVFAMDPPSFGIIKGSDKPSLTNPATVSIHAHGIRWNTQYDPADGFRLEDVPVGEWPILVEDIDDANGVLPSMIAGLVPHNAEVLWEIPVTLRSTLEEIYASVSPPLQIDPERAQVIVTVVSCQLEGGGPRSGYRIVTPEGSDGVIYDVAEGWSLEAATGTGALGVAIVANVPADEYPGALSTLGWDTGSSTGTIPAHRSMRGAVTRIYFSLPC